MADDALVDRFFREEEARRAAQREVPFPSLKAWIEAGSPEQGEVPWHLQQLVALFERAMRERVFALVSMPPRHAKSTTVRRALAYAIRRHPLRLNGFVTYASSYARTHSKAVKKLVVLHGGQLDPGARNVDDWRTIESTADTVGGLSVTGRNGQLTGKGFTGLLVCDDLIKNRKEAESILLRDQLFESFNDDIFSRSEPPFGSIVVVATRWHEDDLIGRLEGELDEQGRKVWEVINLPAIRDPVTGEPTDAENGVALWPERFPLELLKKIRRRGAYGWWSLYQGRPRPRDGKIFKVCTRYTTLPEGGRLVLAVDPAGSASTRANHTVAVAVMFFGYGDQMRGYLVGLLRLQLEPDKAARKLLEFQERWGAALHIEGSRDGVAQAKALRQLEEKLDITMIQAVGDKFTRSQAFAAAWSGNAEQHEPARFFVPSSPKQIDCTAEDLSNYLRVHEKFTGLNDPEDDDVDAGAHAWNTALEMGDPDDTEVMRAPRRRRR